jgi:hypothetical protein
MSNKNIGNDVTPGSAGAIEVVDGYTQKIDNLATNGLAGVSNSLAYRVHKIEKHFHGREKWFGLAASPSGETHRADRMDGAIQPFQLTAGDNDFNATWTQILGSSDTPVTSGSVYFDAHRYLVTSTNSTSPYIIQIITGESTDFASKLSNEQFTETPYVAATNNNDSGIEDVMTIRVAVGEKVWARCACVGQNGTTLDFYFGIHEYAG